MLLLGCIRQDTMVARVQYMRRQGREVQARDRLDRWLVHHSDSWTGWRLLVLIDLSLGDRDAAGLHYGELVEWVGRHDPDLVYELAAGDAGWAPRDAIALIRCGVIPDGGLQQLLTVPSGPARPPPGRRPDPAGVIASALPGRLGGKQALEVLEPLVDHPRSGVRLEVARALARIEASGALIPPALVRRLQDDPEPGVRRSAARLQLARPATMQDPPRPESVRARWAALEQPLTQATLLAWLREEPDAPLRAELLALLGPSLPLATLAAHLADHDPGARRAASAAWLRAGGDPLRIELGTDIGLTLTALDALQAGGQDLPEAWSSLLQHPTPPVREAAVSALSGPCSEARQQPLLEALRDPDPAISRRAATGLWLSFGQPEE